MKYIIILFLFFTNTVNAATVVCGGVDDTSAINNALASNPTGKINLVGNCSVSSPIIFQYGAQHLQGEGRDVTFITAKQNLNSDMIVIGNGTYGVGAGSTISDITINGKWSLQTSGSCIKVYGAAVTQIRNARVKLCYNNGIETAGTTSSLGAAIIDNVIVESYRAGNGIRFSQNSYGHIQGSDISGSDQVGTWQAAISVVGTSDVEIVGNTIDPDIGVGIRLYLSSQVSIIGNHLHSMGNWAVLIDGDSYGNTVNGNVFWAFGSGSQNGGVRLNGTTFNTVSGNSLASDPNKTPANGILEDGASNYNSIVGNTIRGNYAGYKLSISGVNTVSIGNVY